MKIKHLAALLAMLLALGCAGESTTTPDSSTEPDDANATANSEVTDPAPDAEADVETQVVSFNVMGMK